MQKNNLLSTVILKGAHTEEDLKALSSSVFEVASQAHGHLEEAKLLLPRLPRVALQALTPAIRCSMFLDALLKASFNPYHVSILRPDIPLWYQLRLVRLLVLKTV
jgi:NADH dehydrogenase [ubiquinone] 1 alpha subcomplex assembly factor 6